VRRGERLCDIAAQVYLDPAAWREIALANLDRIGNPAQLVPGTVVTIPKR
jgi:nucleoid-associated protein YgaU